MGEEQQREGGERQDNKKVEEGVGEEAVVEKLDKEEDVEEKVEKRGRFNVGNIKVDKVGNKVAGESDTDNTKKEVLAENIESVEPVKKAVEVDEKLERKEAEEEPEQNEEEEPKAIDSSIDDRYLKFDKLTHNLQWIQEIRIFTAYACSEV